MADDKSQPPSLLASLLSSIRDRDECSTSSSSSHDSSSRDISSESESEGELYKPAEKEADQKVKAPLIDVKQEKPDSDAKEKRKQREEKSDDDLPRFSFAAGDSHTSGLPLFNFGMTYKDPQPSTPSFAFGAMSSIPSTPKRGESVQSGQQTSQYPFTQAVQTLSSSNTSVTPKAASSFAEMAKSQRSAFPFHMESTKPSPPKPLQLPGLRCSPGNASSRASTGSSSTSRRRYCTQEEIRQLCSIVIINVPDVTNSRSYLKRVFSEYGNVVKVNSMPSKAMAVIHFDNHDSAANAKKKVRILKSKTKPVEIFWGQSVSSSSRPSSRASSVKEFSFEKTGMRDGCTHSGRKNRSLECAICLGRFQNPKTLPCLHSYCEDCLVTYAPKGSKTLKCPQCKEESKVPDGDATNFKSNFHLKELVEEAAFREELDQPSTKLICNCCDGEDSEAVSRCLDCNQYLCSSGMAAHRKFAVLRDHVVASLDDIRSGKVKPKVSSKQKMMCPKHLENKAEIFCTTCDMPICHVCATLKHKSPDHECVEVNEATEERRQLALQGLQQLEAVKAKLKKSAEQMGRKRWLLNNHVSNLKREIDKTCNSLSQKVEKEKICLYKEVEDLLTADTSSLDECQTDAETRISKISSVQDQAKIMVEGNDFLSMYGIVKSKIEQLSEETPQEHSYSVDELSFMVSNLPKPLVGNIRKSAVKRLKLVSEYPPKHSLSTYHKFYGITSFGNNELAVVDRMTHEVVILDSNMKQIVGYRKCVGLTLNHPQGVAIVGNSELVVIDDSNLGKWWSLDSRNDCKLIKFETDFVPQCIMTSPDDSFVIAGATAEGHRTFILFRRNLGSSKFEKDTTWQDSVKHEPSFFATNGQEILVADTKAKKVVCLVIGSFVGVNFLSTKFTIECTGEPKGVCFDRDGCIYLAIGTGLFFEHSIHQYTSTGQHVACLVTLSHPVYGMAFRKDGELAVACGKFVKLFELSQVSVTTSKCSDFHILDLNY